jgi:hypothetical protein
MVDDIRYSDQYFVIWHRFGEDVVLLGWEYQLGLWVR